MSVFKGVAITGSIVVGLGVVGVVGSYISTAFYAATAPSRVINQTLDTNNIINSYASFRIEYNDFVSRLHQIPDYVDNLKKDTDAKASQVYIAQDRTDLAGVQQSCRDLAAQYNASAQRIDKVIFRGTNVPPTLDITKCDTGDRQIQSVQ